MKLASFVAQGHARIGALVDENTLLDLNAAAALVSGSEAGEAWARDMRDFLEQGQSALDQAQLIVNAARELMGTGATLENSMRFAVDEVKWLPPVPEPSKVVAIGQNYKDHCEEQNVPYPEYATVFAKFPSCLIGHLEEIVYPEETTQLDYEVELAFIVGKTAKNVPQEHAFHYIAGYTVMNDVTARDIQKGEKQWVRGKSFDTFGPCGPYWVTSDEVGDPHGLELYLTVNGETRQRSKTDQLVFNVPYLLSHLSRSFTLLPGDIVTTGTPGGVGAYMKPPALLQKGDEIELGIEKIGVLRNRVR